MPRLLTRISIGPSARSVSADRGLAAFGREQVGRDAESVERIGDLLDVGRRAGGDRHAGALGSQRLRDPQADPARRRGDERDLARDAEVHPRHASEER